MKRWGTPSAAAPGGSPGLVGSGVAIANNAAVTPTNPSHQSGDTLLCIAMVRGNAAATLAVSGSGWTDASSLAGVQAFNGNSIQFFMRECTSSSEANPTVTPSGGADQQTVIATVVRISGRTFGSSFTLGTVSANASNNNTIALAQNSPSISNGQAILAIGLKNNDGGVNNWNAISGQTAGLTWSAISAAWDSNIGNDSSGLVLGAFNNSGGAYTAGTGAVITGKTLSVGATSGGVYLKIAT
jgi:hypothetical protein